MPQGKETSVLLYDLLHFIVPFFCGALCFFIGYLVGKRDEKPIEIKMPDPPKVRKEKRERNAEQQRRLDNLNTLMHNLEVYNGDATGQQKLKGRKK